MRYQMCLGFAILVAGIVLSAIPSNFAAPTSGDAQSDKIKALMQERRDVLAKRVNIVETYYKSGLYRRDQVIDARDDLFVAELDLAETREKRIELLKSRLENIKEGEQLILELQKAGGQGGSETDVLLATSRRLLAEIEFERALATD